MKQELTFPSRFAMSAMTFDSSPIPGAFVPRGLAPFGADRAHQGGYRLVDGGVCIFVTFTQSIAFESIIL